MPNPFINWLYAGVLHPNDPQQPASHPDEALTDAEYREAQLDEQRAADAEAHEATDEALSTVERVQRHTEFTALDVPWMRDFDGRGGRAYSETGEDYEPLESALGEHPADLEVLAALLGIAVDNEPWRALGYEPAHEAVQKEVLAVLAESSPNGVTTNVLASRGGAMSNGSLLGQALHVLTKSGAVSYGIHMANGVEVRTYRLTDNRYGLHGPQQP